ncbi:MAG: hypothetical protein ACRCX2_30145 [Paraclostridium sp.]
MLKSNLDHPYFQPFKSITLTMEDATDKSSPYVHPSDEKTFRNKGDFRYTPVFMKSTSTSGEDLYANSVNSSKGGDYTKGTPIVGVLMESSRFEKSPLQVMVQGIVPMEASGKIRPGHLVSVDLGTSGSDLSKSHKVRQALQDDWAFGIALTDSTKDGDWLAVMLCKGAKLGVTQSV